VRGCDGVDAPAAETLVDPRYSSRRLASESVCFCFPTSSLNRPVKTASARSVSRHFSSAEGEGGVSDVIPST